MHRRLIVLVILLVAALTFTSSAMAQTYAFRVDREIVHVLWNADGSAALDYTYFFHNEAYGAPIDFIDLGLPNSHFDVSSINADVDGQPVYYISKSDYQGKGTGVAIGLEQYAIPPGQAAKVHIYVGSVDRMLRPDTSGDDYASGVFSPNWFGAEFVNGTTNITVIFHLPPGVQPEEPRWHAAPSGWPAEPQTGFDTEGRITYTWANSQANVYTQYEFGASFPEHYVPASAISAPSLSETLGINPDDMIGFLFCCGFAAFIIFIIFISNYSSKKRKLQYFPPKVAIEGHGIKRGLTAIEAAILMQEPMDKILTMILFAVVKKGAATVRKRDPLLLDVTDPQPEGLYPYEIGFLAAMGEGRKASRRKKLQDLMIDLVNSVSSKMKGFSRKETVAYYRNIVQKAWAQVEAADTPDVKSQKYDEVMEWTMLDRDYDDRTRRVFHGGPVFVPIWWHRYDPGFGRQATASPTVAPTAGGSTALPHLPGSDFAASVVNGVQNFSSSVIGNVSDFTSRITNKTNPLPVSTSSGRSSGGGCACACACAGCACACAGGGR